MEFQFEHNTLPGSLELAYLGDTVYDLYVRSHLVQNKGGHVGALHKMAIRYVCAHAQSEAMKRIEAILTEDEAAVARRARNTRQSAPKNADPGEYCRATSLEALIGYLYVTGKNERMGELLKMALPPETIGNV